MLLHALYERLFTAPLNRLPCYGALEVIVTLLLLLSMIVIVKKTPISCISEQIIIIIICDCLCRHIF